jgi:hypothetical protein
MRYLSPELLEGETYTPASDLWSLGLVLWEAALGRFAYSGESDREVLAGIVLGKPLELSADDDVDGALIGVIEPLLRRSVPDRVTTAAQAAALFADLEDRLGDTASQTIDAIEALLEKKDNTAPSLEEIDGKIRSLRGGSGFTDEKTFAEDLSGDADSVEFGEDKTMGVGPPPPAGRLHVGAPSVMDPNVHTAPANAAPGRDPLEPQETVAVPAPVRFDTLSRQMPEAHALIDDDSSEEDATHVDLPTLGVDPSDDQTEQRVREVHEALAALDDDPIGLDDFPPVSIDAQDTVSVSLAPMPSSALRSDVEDLDERAAGFEEGVSLEVEAARPAATAGPAPQLDDDDMESMHTLDGLSPVRDPVRVDAFAGASFDEEEAPEVTMRTPPPAPRTESPSWDLEPPGEPTHTGKPFAKPHRHTPSWDAINAVKAASSGRSHSHSSRRNAGEVGDENEARAVARVDVVRKTAAEIARARAANPAPRPGVSRQAVNIDALPGAKPRPRQETPDERGPSPFDEQTEQMDPVTVGARAPADELEELVPDVGSGDDVDDRNDIDDGEPTFIDTSPPEVTAAVLDMNTSVGAKIVDLPPPAAPLEPLGPFVATEALGQQAEPAVVDEPVEEREYRAGEVVSLSEMAGLLDDD